jgi:hypothetical protein
MRFHRAHRKGELEDPHFYIRITNERVKLTTSLPFLTSLSVRHQSNSLFGIIMEYKTLPEFTGKETI